MILIWIGGVTVVMYLLRLSTRWAHSARRLRPATAAATTKMYRRVHKKINSTENNINANTERDREAWEPMESDSKCGCVFSFCHCVTPITACRLKYYDIIAWNVSSLGSNAAGGLPWNEKWLCHIYNFSVRSPRVCELHTHEKHALEHA